jgi:rhodanese-related sulfurtransferase
MNVIKRSTVALLLLAAVASCRTVGVAKERGGFASVSPQVAYEMLLDNKQLVLLDFRSENEYWGPLGHIAGALSAPLDAIENRLPELLPYQDSTVIVYGDDKDESARGARILIAAGFDNVVSIDGGIRAWIERGYRTVTPR